MLSLVCRISHAHCTLYTYTHRHSIVLAPRHGQRVRCSCIRVRFRTCHEMSGNAKQRIISLDHICFGKFSIIILLKIFHSFLNGIDLNLSQMNMKSTYHFDLFKSQKKYLSVYYLCIFVVKIPYRIYGKNNAIKNMIIHNRYSVDVRRMDSRYESCFHDRSESICSKRYAAIYIFKRFHSFLNTITSTLVYN